MSYIYEALEKSERTRSKESASSAATEVLRLAEAVECSTLDEASESLHTVTSGAAEMESDAPSPAVAVEPHDHAEVPFTSFSHFDERTLVFESFKSLAICPVQQSRLVGLGENDSAAAEAFRLLAVRLRHLRRERPIRVVLVTSTVPQEGKTMVATNLASMLAPKSEERVLLVEGDIRRPTIASILGLGAHHGLCEALKGERSLSETIYELDGAGFWVLPAGRTEGNELELLKSSRLFAFIEQLRTWFDWIVIDSPPILPLADTSVWSRLVDGLLLVTREAVTDKHELQRGIEALGTARMLGAVVNCSSHSPAHYHYYKSSQPTAGASRSA